ncbi:putative membrane-bound dehydrogenase-like protein [Anseongella ginsenosidimutans]|uniref:Putative membrane-bound dehydrogenase-like protein n=1 Tax=Anseongella ginsenosidimutans TaxID=496056 RepID=A0A4R3KN35_9SPHI|nr:PVC-type heme-binding CxxCH protein [Anseongella ginsenosidimutans]QEC51894.1 dehydrogenase [Anseongella ginsenosidimutans]TCS85084.1 putative membrane-bound dehydrogenase-like protein [Anseongella ginsenosidimutans]
MKSIRASYSIKALVLPVFSTLLLPALFLTACSGNKEDRLKDLPDDHPEKELASFEVAEGFEVSLFAAEPLVEKPIQMNWDAQGRLWVVSSTAYPHLKTGEIANDKIFILEDTDGDGAADKSTIFAEGLTVPTGILPGDGGVYVANSTEILHLSDTDGDGKADTRRKILDGFGTGDAHHLIHTFRWGPEGRMYFNQSIYIHSHVETPWGIRRLEGGGVWKLQPQTLELDVYAKGLINPWGLRFDKFGQSFLTDGAGGEGINYAFPGATFVTSPGAERILRGLNPGQPKHCGLDIVSGRHLPESWQGSLIANDFRANRINRFQLEEQGSGYASKQMPDLLWTDHVAFRPVDITIGPDGAIYVADWYNPIIQHGEVDFYDPRRDHQRGRIWRITAKDRDLVKKPELAGAAVTELLDALKEPEAWTRSQARQLLKERGAKEVAPALKDWIEALDKENEEYERLKLEALWVSQAIDTYNGPLLESLLNAKDHKVRAAALRALQLWHKQTDNLEAILQKAANDTHPQVRLEAVIALRTLNSAEAAKSALAVLDQPMDEFLDFALWQTVQQLEPEWIAVLKSDPAFFGDPAKTSYALKSAASPEAITLLTQLYKKGEVPEKYRQDALSAIAKRGQVQDLNDILDIAITGFSQQKRDVSAELAAIEAAAVQRKVAAGKQLSRLGDIIKGGNEASAMAAMKLAGALKVNALQPLLRSRLNHENRNYARTAMSALAAINPASAQTLIKNLTTAKHPLDLRLIAVSELALINAPEAAKIGAGLLNELDNPEQAQEVFNVFLSDRGRLHALAEELVATRIPEKVALAARQHLQKTIPANRREEADVKLLVQGLEASGGVLAAERMPQDLDADQIKSIAAEAEKGGNPLKGEHIFRRQELACLNCHAVGGAGGLIGPDLSSLGTSSPAETIIKSLMYPTESIKEGYELQRVSRKDLSEIMGYLVSDRPNEIVMRNAAGQEVSIPKDNIGEWEKVPGSLMPPGLTARLDKQEFLDLVSFLSSLGESGDFRVPAERFVRRWQMIPASEELADKITAEGVEAISREDKLSFQPNYSTVSGTLPLDELPVIEPGSGAPYSFVRFQVEVLTPGDVTLNFNDQSGIRSWANAKEVTIKDGKLVTSLPQGIHHITLAIDRNTRKQGPLSVMLIDGAAQTRLVMGR